MALPPKILKTARVLMLISILISAYFNINAAFIDFDSPGSLIAQKLTSWANYLFLFTLICALPLLYEKYNMLSAWEDRYTLASDSEKKTMVKIIFKPVINSILVIIVMTILAIILIQIFHPISPEQIANYQAYYSQPKPISYP